MPERQVLLEAAARLEAATEDLGRKFEAVDVFAHETAAAHKRTRELTRLLAVGLITQLIIIGVLAWTMNRANDANSRSVRTAEYQVANCAATNEIRAADKAFWADILAVIAPADGTAGQKAFAAKIQAKVDKRYAPRDCSAVTEGRVR